MNKYKKVIFPILLIVSGVIIFFFRTELLAMVGVKPEIIKDYVCSDVCTEGDIKKVYKDVTDESYCKKIGGTPYTYYRWGEFTACLAE